MSTLFGIATDKKKAIIEKFFEPCVLYLLLRGPSHGYELRADLELKCHCYVDTGNLYRALRKLESSGYITSILDGPSKARMKRTYSVTERGKLYLGEWIEELQEQDRIITKLISHYNKAIS